MRGTGRPTAGYRLADNTRVPSVTTITGRFKDSGALIRWAYRCGQDGIDIDAAKDKAGTAGSIAHGWIELWLNDPMDSDIFQDDVDPETFAKAEAGFGAFREWADMTQLEIEETETPLISETHRYGGTLDAVGLVSGQKKLLDWKTSNGVYLEYVVQLAAYRNLLRERDGDDAPASAMLLRVGKEHADFHLHSYPESVLDMGWEWFVRARQMYDLDKSLKKVAA